MKAFSDKVFILCVESIMLKLSKIVHINCFLFLVWLGRIKYVIWCYVFSTLWSGWKSVHLTHFDTHWTSFNLKYLAYSWKLFYVKIVHSLSSNKKISRVGLNWHLFKHSMCEQFSSFKLILLGSHQSFGLLYRLDAFLHIRDTNVIICIILRLMPLNIQISHIYDRLMHEGAPVEQYTNQ